MKSKLRDCEIIGHNYYQNKLKQDECFNCGLLKSTIESISQQDLGEFTSQKLPDESKALEWDRKSEPLKKITIEQEREIYSLLLGFSVGLLGKDGGEYSANKMLERIKEILL